jgi:hypothetical protein
VEPRIFGRGGGVYRRKWEKYGGQELVRQPGLQKRHLLMMNSASRRIRPSAPLFSVPRGTTSNTTHNRPQTRSHQRRSYCSFRILTPCSLQHGSVSVALSCDGWCNSLAKGGYCSLRQGKQISPETHPNTPFLISATLCSYFPRDIYKERSPRREAAPNNCTSKASDSSALFSPLSVCLSVSAAMSDSTNLINIVLPPS